MIPPHETKKRSAQLKKSPPNETPRIKDQKLTEILEEISKKAKKLGMKFEIKEK